MTDKGACRGEGKQANVGKKSGKGEKKKKKKNFEGRKRVAPGHHLTCPRVKWFSESKRKKPWDPSGWYGSGGKEVGNEGNLRRRR